MGYYTDQIRMFEARKAEAEAVIRQIEEGFTFFERDPQQRMRDVTDDRQIAMKAEIETMNRWIRYYRNLEGQPSRLEIPNPGIV